MFVPVTPPPPSARARALGDKMAELIRIFRESDPGLTMPDIKQAMTLAAEDVRAEIGGGRLQYPVLIALLVGVVLAGLFVALYVRRSGIGVSPLVLVVVVGLIIVGIGIAAIATRR